METNPDPLYDVIFGILFHLTGEAGAVTVIQSRQTVTGLGSPC